MSDQSIEPGSDRGSVDPAPIAQPAGANAQHVREWGRANGYTVKDTGRLPNGLREAYESNARA